MKKWIFILVFWLIFFVLILSGCEYAHSAQDGPRVVQSINVGPVHDGIAVCAFPIAVTKSNTATVAVHWTPQPNLIPTKPLVSDLFGDVFTGNVSVSGGSTLADATYTTKFKNSGSNAIVVDVPDAATLVVICTEISDHPPVPAPAPVPASSLQWEPEAERRPHISGNRIVGGAAPVVTIHVHNNEEFQDCLKAGGPRTCVFEGKPTAEPAAVPSAPEPKAIGPTDFVKHAWEWLKQKIIAHQILAWLAGLWIIAGAAVKVLEFLIRRQQAALQRTRQRPRRRRPKPPAAPLAPPLLLLDGKRNIKLGDPK